MQLDEQQEPTSDEHAAEHPPAMTGMPIHVSYDDPHPYAQRLPKMRLAILTSAMVALVIFGIAWRTLRSGDDAAPVRAESVLTEQQRSGQSAIDQARAAQRDQIEHAEESQQALEGLTSHDPDGGAR